LLEATSSTAEGEHKQESSKEDPSTPHPKWLMLALFFALFIETMAITIAIQISSQGRESIPLFYLGGGVIGPTIHVIVAGVIFVLAIYYRFTHAADVKEKALFGILFTAGIVLGLAMEALSLILPDGFKNNPWLNHVATSLAGMIIAVELLLIGYFFFNSSLGGDKCDAFWGFYAGWSLGHFMSLLLAVANWGLQEEGDRTKLFCAMLAFFSAGTVAYFLVAIIAFAQKEVKDEVENPTSALVAK
jgi:hypothetical protein